MTTVKSCKMIDAEIYGMMPSANTDSFSSAPPEKKLKKPSSVPCCCLMNLPITTRSTPGVVMKMPMR